MYVGVYQYCWVRHLFLNPLSELCENNFHQKPYMTASSITNAERVPQAQVKSLCKPVICRLKHVYKKKRERSHYSDSETPSVLSEM